MQQLNMPAALLRALKGPAISIVVACLIEPERRLSIRDLQALTGYSPNTIRHGLSTLSELGLIRRTRDCYQLTDRMQQIMLPPPVPHTDTDRASAQNLRPPPVAAQELRATPQDSSQSEYWRCSDPVSRQRSPTPNTLAQPAQKSSASYERLVDAGVYPHVASDLAADPWVTAGRVEDWLQDLRDQNRRFPGAVRSIPAVLASNLRAHREPPCQPAEPDEDRRRFAAGPYADYIVS